MKMKINTKFNIGDTVAFFKRKYNEDIKECEWCAGKGYLFRESGERISCPMCNDGKIKSLEVKEELCYGTIDGINIHVVDKNPIISYIFKEEEYDLDEIEECNIMMVYDAPVGLYGFDSSVI